MVFPSPLIPNEPQQEVINSSFNNKPSGVVKFKYSLNLKEKYNEIILDFSQEKETPSSLPVQKPTASP